MKCKLGYTFIASPANYLQLVSLQGFYQAELELFTAAAPSETQSALLHILKAIKLEITVKVATINTRNIEYQK